jgi:phospholipid transport system substrate-binding protein
MAPNFAVSRPSGPSSARPEDRIRSTTGYFTRYFPNLSFIALNPYLFGSRSGMARQLRELAARKTRCPVAFSLRIASRAFAFALLLAFAPLGHAALAADEASVFMVELGRQAIAAMTNNAVSSADRVREFGTIVDRDFDVPKIAQFMLGRFWQSATDRERNDFTHVFRDYMIRTYADHFSQYRSDSFRVVDQRAVSDAVTIVRTNITLTSTDQPMTLEWQVIRKPDGFKVNDLSVGGASLAVAQREEFASALQRDGGQISLLTEQVKSKLTQLETAAR